MNIVVEADILIHFIVKKKGLSMRLYSNVNLISHNGERRLFLGVCENIEILIDGVNDLHHIRGVKAADHQHVLGQSCLLQMRLK